MCVQGRGARAATISQVDRSELGHERAVLPDIQERVRRDDHVVLREREVSRLDIDVFRVKRRPYRVA